MTRTSHNKATDDAAIQPETALAAPIVCCFCVRLLASLTCASFVTLARRVRCWTAATYGQTRQIETAVHRQKQSWDLPLTSDERNGRTRLLFGAKRCRWRAATPPGGCSVRSPLGTVGTVCKDRDDRWRRPGERGATRGREKGGGSFRVIDVVTSLASAGAATPDEEGERRGRRGKERREKRERERGAGEAGWKNPVGKEERREEMGRSITDSLLLRSSKRRRRLAVGACN